MEPLICSKQKFHKKLDENTKTMTYLFPPAKLPASKPIIKPINKPALTFFMSKPMAIPSITRNKMLTLLL